ncbi:apolipoprotein L domain-containing protein 1-like [Pseudorasbora parva]|uniref:apolipoprotein L domain-containing protein 1-like n=1 Tax=Pseudorasbora parva TaxID=51549 RepID=UPI00351ECD2F
MIDIFVENLTTLTLQTDKDKTSSFKHLQKTANPSTPPVPAIRLKKCVPGSWELMGMNKSPQGGERHPLASGPHNSSQNYYSGHGTVSELRIQRNVLLMAAVPNHLAGGFQDTHSQDRESSWKGNILNRTGGSDSDSRDFEKTLKHYVSHLPFCATALQRQTAELREVADALDKTHKGTRIARITGGTTGAVGGVAAVAGILLAPATLGASLAVTAIGVGVATAGGITGASAAITKKVKKNQVRKKVESILKEYQCEMSDIEVYLNNISVEMGKLKGVTARTARLVEVARGTPDALGAMNRSSGVIQGFALGMDLFFSDKDSQKLKKGSKTRFAQKIREVADQIQASLTELMDMREKLISEGI